ncbi:HEPN domain-containing protein [Nostoc sp.]|uniref:ApeA N-terminal domain 1-containing protein n=1 Tax=Nostoc sp. TaxID=1180 RepID=UPI002FF91162
MESFEKHGIWFLPESPNTQIYGKLLFSSVQMPTLKLAGELKEFDIKQKLEEDITYSVINGYLIGEKGEDKITLCNGSQKKEFRTGIQTSEIYIEYILKGYHFSSLDEINFNTLEVQYSYLEKWVNLPNVTINCIKNQEQSDTFKEINLQQRLNEKIEIGKLNDCSISIIDEPWFGSSFLNFANLFGWNSSEILLKEQKRIIIRSEEGKKINDLLITASSFQEFLTFACGQIISILQVKTYIIAKTKDFETQLNDGNIEVKEIEKEKRFLIEIYYQASSPLIERQNFDSRQILFNFNDISSKTNIILRNWELNQEKLKSVIELYLRLYYTPVCHVNDLFLSLAQAIEGFHRIHHQGKYCKDEIFDDIKKSLKETLLSKLIEHSLDCYQDSLVAKINYWNEYSLKERLENLFNDSDFYACLPKNFFPNSEDQKNFIKQVRDTRGSLSHPDSNNSNKTIKPSKYIVSGRDLNNLIYKLRIIIEICLLKTLGLDSSSIKPMINKRF